ncbi:MAG: TIGR04552 family protein [Gammaproteobacteria bacterium]|nr:TIGR04552 family protein [Gammaproteobacteria bacterium]
MNKHDARIPVISDPEELNIPWQTLQTIIAGKSLLDTFELHVDSLDEAHRFLHAYGLDANEDIDKLRFTALEYIDSVLLQETRLHLPDEMIQLSLPELLLAASSVPRTTVSEWSCVILKVCHAVAHAQWTRDESAGDRARLKIKNRLEPYVIESGDGFWIGDEGCRIPIVEYSIKTEKQFFRLVTKLLLKEGNLSARIYDHIGMRFVTHDIFSAILLIKFLRSRNIFMYANVLPHESRNSLAEFHQIESLFAEFSDPVEEIDIGSGGVTWPPNENSYSSKKFKMIKIIERILVTTETGRKVFFPCEIQILTRSTQESLSKKKTQHSAYEKRQIKGVKRRLFHRTSLIEQL